MSEVAKRPANAGSASKHDCCGGGAPENDTQAKPATHVDHECCGGTEPAHPAQSSCGCGTSTKPPEAKAHSTSTK
jgi:hypothetical protein